MDLLPHLLAHIMFMSRDPFVYAKHLQTLQSLLFVPLFTCILYVLVKFIHSLLHVYAG